MNAKSAVIHENVPIIEVDNSLTLDHLIVDPVVADAVVMRLGPTTAVVDPAKFEALAARLLKLGHLPKVVEL